jgi:protein required for attachment to host cells
MSKTFILVAEGSRAKLYAATSPTAALTELEDFILPEGRMHEGDLVSDQPGSDGGAIGQGRHVIDKRTRATDVAHAAFAKSLVERLERGRNTSEFDQLVMIAPPAFLGLLRSELSPGLSRMVAEEIDKNLVLLSPDEVRMHTSVLR